VNKERKLWLMVTGSGAFVALGLGALIYLEIGKVDAARTEVADLRTTVTTSRKLIEGTSALEREVIVQREMSTVVRDILPDEEDMNNWVRTIQGFSAESGVKIRGLKKPDATRGKKTTAFDEVTYAFTFEADAFQLLDFFNYVETHSRFMRVPSFKITAAKRSSVETLGYAAHNLQADIQTFVYEPKDEEATVKIEGYDRKRDLMVGEINRRRQDLALSSFTYRGARGRRDPWVDPRVPVDGGSVLSVPDQMEIVQNLFLQVQEVQELWTAVKNSQNVIEEMMVRHDLEEQMAYIEEELRRVEGEGSITYLPSQRRLQLEVVDAMFDLRKAMTFIEGSRGPSVEKLREVLEAMDRHMAQEEYILALDAYRLVSEQLAYIETDPLRKPFVEQLRRKALVARIVRDFEGLEIEVGGVAIMEGGPSSALINGQSLSVGDMFAGELIVNDIQPDEIEFIFRGVVLARRF